MTQGFDEWYFKQNHLGIEPIDHARESYKAGAASRQAEIDNLEGEIKETQAFLNNQNNIKQTRIDELQKRIDDALEKCFTGIRKQGGDYYLELVVKILKGNQND